MLNRARIVSVAASAATFVIFTAPARAELGWTVDTGVSHTDNAALTEDNRVSDTLRSVGGAIAYGLEGRRLQASLNARGSYIDYANNTFDNDFQSYASGGLSYGIVPERFVWSLDDTYGQIAVDQFEPVTPDNRQDINTFSTGPDVILRLGSQSDLKMSARLRDASYEESDQIDSRTILGSIALRRHLSATSLWGVVASTSHVKYDAPGDPTYDQPSLYATWQGTLSRQTVSLDVGANQVETGGQSYTRPLVRLNWDRRLAPSWGMNVYLGSEYQNTSEQFVNQNLHINPGTAEIGISQAPAASYYGGVLLGFERPRTRFSVRADYSKQDYPVDNGLNESSWNSTVTVSRRHTPRVESFLSYRIEKHNYESSLSVDDTRQRANFGVDVRMGKALFLTGGYRYSHSDSDAITNRYSASVFYLTLSFRQGTITESRSFD
jgi:hypothetical protein